MLRFDRSLAPFIQLLDQHDFAKANQWVQDYLSVSKMLLSPAEQKQALAKIKAEMRERNIELDC